MLETWKRHGLEQRLSVFLDAGLIPEIPTPWQMLQGTVAMLPYVLSSDAVLEPRYQGAPLAHPFLRQPLLLAVSGRDHVRVGPAFDAKLHNVCKHIFLTYHWGMPVFDLQVLQTHPGGLEYFRARTEELLAAQTPWAKRMRKLQALILPRGDEYLREFLGDDGFIARVARLSYPTPAEESSAFPSEFFSLVDFLNHCATAYPKDRSATPWYRVPGRLAFLLSRRFREGRSLGWLPHERRRMLTATQG